MKKHSVRVSRAVPVTIAVLAGVLSLVVACGSDTSDDDNKAGSSGNTGFGGGGDGGSSGSGTEGCATTSKRAETPPVDIGLALDTSWSMNYDQKWINTKAALKAFVNNPAYNDLSMALQFYPVRKQCSVADYAIPAVEMGLFPAVAPAVSTALDAQSMEYGTPITQVLDGMAIYMRANAAKNPSHKQIILLASDGLPDETCKSEDNGLSGNSIEAASAKVRAAYNDGKPAGDGTPSIPTFVIGVGSELDGLNQIAAAGGSERAILIDPTKNVQEEFLKALENIRRSVIPCDYPIPQSTDFDAAKVNVTYNASSGVNQTFGYVGGLGECAKAPDTGYYFDNPTAPTKVTLCPKTCERVKADDQGEINIVFGCDRFDVR